MLNVACVCLWIYYSWLLLRIYLTCIYIKYVFVWKCSKKQTIYNNEEHIYGNIQTEGKRLFALAIICWRMARHTRYVIKFVSDWRQVGGFLRVLWFLSPIKTDRHDITEISLKVALNAITVTSTPRLHICAYNAETIKVKWHLSLNSTNRENLSNKNVDIICSAYTRFWNNLHQVRSKQ